MRSKWFGLKPDAIKLREKGFSISRIERHFKIPRSTLSGWFKNVKLSQKQKEKLIKNWKNALVKARKKAALWHNNQKENRLREAEDQALKTIENIDITNKENLELALAILYMGEGAKKRIGTSMGSSSPLILKFFLTALKILYNLDFKKIKCQLNLRADQSPDKMKRFWAKELKIPIDNFGYVGIDKRTIGSKTYSYYNGVCHVFCGNVAIQRKLIYISEIFFKKIIKKYLGAWRSG